MVIVTIFLIFVTQNLFSIYLEKVMKTIKIIECPRDAMQGIKSFIPTERKVAYIQSLLRVGFDSIDFGSFVSAKAIPQMQDTAEVLEQLDLSQNHKQVIGHYSQYTRSNSSFTT